MAGLEVRPGLVVPEHDLSWAAVRASGPGGQNVNKVSSKVELRFAFETSAALGPAVKARLRKLAENRLDAAGRILIVSQLTRNQPQNLNDARTRLAALIAQALIIPKRRRATRPTKSSKRARLSDKRAHAQKKQNRSHPRSDD